jgi:glucose-6-phosphate 1-dehydrogenase
MSQSDPSILVIFGASGDLTQRKLLPAMFHLHQDGLLPQQFAILGVSRTRMDDEAFRTLAIQSIRTYGEDLKATDEEISAFAKSIHYQSIETAREEGYSLLKKRLHDLQHTLHIPGNVLFYLSTPPSLYSVIPVLLATQGLNRENDGWKRLVIEKPFGIDLQSAKDLNRKLLEHYNEHQIYRIDHYLGKETVQNMLVFRFANEFFEPLWNRKYIDHVEVTAAEHIGVEKRGGYYDQSGALRDMVQNHLMQVTAMIAMDPPSHFDARSVRNETIKVFQSLRPLDANKLEESVVLGQYTSSTIKGKASPGYREEEGVPDDSRTETYAAIKLYIDNFRWSGVPFYIRTGKRLPTRVTEVALHFRKTAMPLFGLGESSHHQNVLILRIQPDEGIQLKFGMKVPGQGFNAQTVNMDFKYSDLSHGRVPAAYERLLLDALNGDATLYTRGDAVEECWAFLAPLLERMKAGTMPLHGYPGGTWGPKAADQLLETQNHNWRCPCKNLAEDGVYCEL